MIAELLAASSSASQSATDLLIGGGIGSVSVGVLGAFIVKWLLGKHDRDIGDLKSHVANNTEIVTLLVLSLKMLENSPYVHEQAKKIQREEERLKMKASEFKT